MSKTDKKTMVSILLDPKSIETLDYVAQNAHLTRSKVIHNLISVGYDEMEIQQNIGILKLTILLRQVKNAIPSIFKEAKKKIRVTEDSTRKDSVSVRMDSDLLQEIDELAKQIDLTRKSFIEYVLEFEMRELKMMLLIPGALKAGIAYHEVTETIRRNWKKTFEESKEVIENKQINLNGDSENGSE